MAATATNLPDELPGKCDNAELRRHTAELLAENQSEREGANSRHADAVKKAADDVERAQFGLRHARSILGRAQSAAVSAEVAFARRDDQLRATMERTEPRELRAFIQETLRLPAMAGRRFKATAIDTDRLRLDTLQPERILSSNADRINAYIKRVKEARAAAELLVFKPLNAEDLAAELRQLRDLIGDF